MKKKIEIKNKLTNHLIVDGKKKTSEKLLLKSIKALQKSSQKQVQKIIQLAITNTTPIFKLHKSENKKRKKKKVKIIPTFIAKPSARTSLAIKLILKNIEEKKATDFYLKLKQNISLTAQTKSSAINLKVELQKEALVNKRFLRYYRWQ